MTDVVQKMISLDGIPNRLCISNLRLDTIHLCHHSPHNAKECENYYVVKYTVKSAIILISQREDRYKKK